MQHRSLEKHPWFGYLAWSTVIGFAVFVGHMSLQLQSEIEHLTIHQQELFIELEP